MWICEASSHARRTRLERRRALGGASTPPPLYSARCAGRSSSSPCSRCWSVSSGRRRGQPRTAPSGSSPANPTTLDPAAQGDSGSAAITAQLFESLTAFDAEREVRPALAESWRFDDGARRVTFHLRDGLTFSDGSPLRPSDVARSWMRLIDPDAPVAVGVDRRSTSRAPRHTCAGSRATPLPSGIHADDAANDRYRRPRPAGGRLRQHRRRPELQRRSAGRRPGPGGAHAGQGLRRERRVRPDRHDLERPLADSQRALLGGQPAISTIELVGDLGGRSPVEAFENGELDYAPISSIDAPWIVYDETLGPQLIEVPTLSVRVLRLHHDPSAIRRRRGSARPSARPSTGAGWCCSPTRAVTSSSPIRWFRPGSRDEARQTSCRRTIPSDARRSSPRPASRVERVSRTP